MGSSGVCAGRCLGESRRNSVHKCPETASRGRFSRSVYTLASPQSLARLGGATGPTTPTAPWPRATQVFGPKARPIGAVTQPPTHTNSRSLSKCGSHHIFYLYNVIQITFWKGWNGQRRSKELGYLAGVAPSQAAHPKRGSSGGQDMGPQRVWQSPLPKLRLPQPRGDRPGHTE